jgi:hypothetical protein
MITVGTLQGMPRKGLGAGLCSAATCMRPEASMDQTPNHESAAAVVPAPLERKAAAHQRKMVALLVIGLAMPALFGVGAALVAALFDLGFTGMDDYVPLFVGGLIGCCVGGGFVVAGVFQLVSALRCRRSPDPLAE